MRVFTKWRASQRSLETSMSESIWRPDPIHCQPDPVHFQATPTTVVIQRCIRCTFPASSTLPHIYFPPSVYSQLRCRILHTAVLRRRRYTNCIFRYRVLKFVVPLFLSVVNIASGTNLPSVLLVSRMTINRHNWRPMHLWCSPTSNISDVFLYC